MTSGLFQFTLQWFAVVTYTYIYTKLITWMHRVRAKHVYTQFLTAQLITVPLLQCTLVQLLIKLFLFLKMWNIGRDDATLCKISDQLEKKRMWSKTEVNDNTLIGHESCWISEERAHSNTATEAVKNNFNALA